MPSNKKLSDREKELIEIIKLAYQKFYLNDIHLSRAMVENIMEKAIRGAIGDQAYGAWLNHLKIKINQ